jgi:hypothetical protein
MADANQQQPALPAAIPAAPAPVVRVARTPAQYTIAQPLDFAQRNDITIFKNGCAPLDGDKYDGTKLKMFLTKLQFKANQYNWNEQGMLTYGPTHLNLLTQYGEITMAQVRQQAEIYQPLLERRCQNSTMMFQCINASITAKVLVKVSTDPTRYTIVIPAVPAQAQPAEIVQDGPCFLKAIIDDTYANTATNVVLAQRNLANLREYIKTVPEYNIITFHQYVKEQLQELEVANKMTTDLMVNLFAAYREVPDKQFKGYVQPIQDQHYDARQPQNPNGLTLMTMIENYYKGMVKDGIWMKPDADQETIIALKAQIEAKQHPKSGKTCNDWKLVPPKPGESRKKIVTVNGERLTYYWCQYHQRWTMHKPQDCRLKSQAQPQPEPKLTATSTPNKQKRDKNQGLVLRVMNAILEDDESDNGSIQ